MKKNIKWMVLCLVFVLAGLAYFYTFYERVEYKTKVDASYDVKYKTFYAAEQFLKKQGINAISTKHRNRLVNLPETTSALFVPNLTDQLSEEKIQEIMDWVKSGGRLFVFADESEAWHELDESENPILREMNVRVRHSQVLFPDVIYEYCNEDLEGWMQCLEDDACHTLFSEKNILKSAGSVAEKGYYVWQNRDDYVNDESKKKSSTCTSHYCYSKTNDALLASNITPVFLNPKENHYGVTNDLIFDFDREISLDLYEGQADVVLQSDSTIAGLQFYVGEGVVSIFASYEFLSQYDDKIAKDESMDDTGNHIGRHDHAYFLWQNVKDRTSVWFFENTQYTGFIKMALKKVPYFLLTAVLALVLFLLWMSRRMGPIHPNINQSRRSVLEHLQMSADFEWRLDQCAKLLNKNQMNLMSLIHKKHPKTKRLNQTEVARYLSERLNLDKEAIYMALYSSAKNERQFISITQHIQTLRNTL